MASQSSRLADLAIVVPPSYSEPKQSKAYRRDLKNIMNIVYQTTNPGGVCCLILSGGMSESSDVAVIADAGALSLFEDQWALREEIIWVRDSNTRNSGERGIEMINLEETPFSHIFVLERFGAKMEFVPKIKRGLLLRGFQGGRGRRLKNRYGTSLLNSATSHATEFQGRSPSE